MAVVICIVVLFFAIKIVQKVIEDRKWEAAIKAQEEMNRKIALRDEREKEMAQAYLENELLKTILLYICDGDFSNLPYRIDVKAHGVESKNAGRNTLRNFRFLDHRIENLKYYVSLYEPSEVVALAYAINQKLGNNYECKIDRISFSGSDNRECEATLTLTATRSF